MNRAESRRNKKLADKSAKNTNLFKPTSPIPIEQQQTLTIQQAIDKGLQYHKVGDLPKAEGIYQQILKSEPNQTDALHLLGVIAHQVGNDGIALDLITKALVINPDNAEAHSNLGLVLKGLGNLDDAVISYRKALALKPDHAEAHSNLGVVLGEQGKPGDAITSYHKALSINPDYADAHNNLGNLLLEQGKLDDAVASFHKALVINPNYVEAYYNLGNALHEQGKLDEVIASYLKALSINPDYADAHNNLGNALQEQGMLDDAATSYLKALAINPNYVEAQNNLGTVLKKQGKADDAVASYHKALAIKPYMDGWHIRKALTLPVILSSLEEIQSRRSQLIASIKELRNRNLSIDDPYVDIGVTNFYLTYHAQDNKKLLESISILHLSACPKLAYEAKHCDHEYSRKKGRIRIGFISSFFRDHTIGKLYKGVIEFLSKDKFEIVIFQSTKKKDEISKAIFNAAYKVVPMYKKLEQDRKGIAAEELDILFYPDIGMDPYTYFLAFARLAPVQIVSWGHPETSGIPNIDYFLSSDLIEQEGSSNQYTEQLAKLSLMPTYYYRPEPPVRTFSRSDFDLPEAGYLYVCPQTLFKLHPDFDLVLAELLIKDLEGHLVLINDNQGGHLKKLVEKRIQATYPDIFDRVIFIPSMDRHKYMGLIMLADALLDIPNFSGGNSSLEAFAMSAPIVTWPGAFMRGQVTAGYYAQMGLNELIASNSETYVSLSLKLAHDDAFKSRMQAEIKANSHKLFERMEVVREMETFFIKAHKAWQNETLLSNEGFISIHD